MEKANKYYVYLIITVLCFVLYGNTLQNKYALDDTLVYTANTFTKQGFKGLHDIFAYDTFTGFFGKDKNLVAGGRYRPLSLVTFATEVEFFGDAPAISHFINILLYVITCILLFIVLDKLLPDNRKHWYLSIPFAATVLFLIHPVHTEVVANIKGRDEMMTLIGALISFIIAIDLLNGKNKTKQWLLFAASFVSFFLALLSKENAITFLAIIPGSIYIFKKTSYSRIFFVTAPAILASFVFLYIRHRVLGDTLSEPITEVMNNPFIDATTSQKFATIFYTLGIYIKLLFWPHPLTFDYYPYHIPIVGWTNPLAAFSGIVYFALFAYMIWAVWKKRFNGFTVLIYLASLSVVSNLFFPIGTFMNERFIFIPSIGFTVFLAYLFLDKLPEYIKNRKLFVGTLVLVFLPILLLASYKIIDRNKAWKDDLTLFTTDVKVSFNSAKSTCSAGGKLYESALTIQNDSLRKFHRLDSSLYYLRRAVAIHPAYTDALLLLGNVFYEYKMYDSMLYYYKRILPHAPYYQKVYENLPLVVGKYSDPDRKIKEYEYFYNYNKYDYDLLYNLGAVWGKEKNNIPKAIFYLERAYTLNPNRKEALKDLGVAYGMSGQAQKAIEMFTKAQMADPDDPQIYFNLAISYKMLGDEAQYQKYIEISNKLKAKKQ